ncbi:hypothetical protein [Tunturibacter empetritectus]|uniref:Uncharacterized protein n=1 Tax=Tunturiibacter lichenicola TaxID=2051959 RepID=A0A7W8J4T7_9BACT|nr:hypothetical protein [Edaphobacter lichenicola]MBB5342653.1 hypothetical protein [Edaphobacter lichenicola]
MVGWAGLQEFVCGSYWLLWVWQLGARRGGRAQDADVPILHVYANTIQIPVLVLGQDRKKIGPIAPSRFSVSRDGGIVEFPRPYNSTRGKHQFVVTIANSNAFIRSTGISLPLQDAKVLADPSTIRSDPSLAPEEGTRRILTPPQ